MILEICAGSINSAIAAQDGGADRIELCSDLAEGGITPGPGLINLACKLLNIPVFVLIRPRAGDFFYYEIEFASVKDDVKYAKDAGAEGIVTGFLKEDGKIDLERTSQVLEWTYPMKVTFHRAFDMTIDPFNALEDLISIGVERVLTSGQQQMAVQGLDLLKLLNENSNGRIIIMAGGGIREENILQIANETGIKEFHASLRTPVISLMKFVNPAVRMGHTAGSDYEILETDVDRVRKIRSLLDSLE